ncbi:hybrid sensor histidine kinase/response regulator, partial [Falsiroseomonas oryziterrae]|uniref:hybrid sensor histidine kinase/response regulator n=1 Tax=Falsiroseomonas oryziterrae TaxID=2911368 RepID=UPI001F3EA515
DEAAAARESRHAGRLAASEARTTAAEIDARAAWARAAELGTSLGRRIAEGQARLLASQAAVTSLERATEGPAAEHIAVALREADLRAVIESAIDCAIVTTDHEGLVLAWNSGARRLLGWDEASASALNLAAALPPEDRDRGVLAADIAAALSGARVSREGQLIRQDGSTVWAGIEAMALRADGVDEPVGVLWMLRDRTAAQQSEAALREREARLRGVLDGMTEAFGLLAPDFTILEHNREALRMDGRPREEIVGRSHWEAYPGTEDTELGRLLKHAMGARVPVSLQHRYGFANGRALWLDMRAYPTADGSLAVFWRDVTDRKEAEAALREKDARYRALFESIETGFCIIELRFDAPDGRTDYRVVEANPAFYRHTGFPQAILGRWLREAAPALEEHWYERYGRVARTGQPERFEEGSDLLGRWFEVYAFRIDPPEACQVAILFSDVSTRHAAEVLELEIAARTAERDRIWETSPDLMVAVDSAGIVRRVNPAWTALLGYSPEELVGHHVSEFVLPEDHAETVAAYELAAAGGRPRIVNRYRHKDGSTHWISWVAAPAQDVTYAIGRDVTRETEQEAALALAQAALRQSQKLEAIGHLTGGIAHDFNNMLQGVTGGLDMARRRIEAGRLEDAARYLDAARDAAGRAAGLTRRLLAFARRQTLDPRPLDPDVLVRNMAEMLRRTMGPAITLELDLQDGFVTCDPNELESALLNLCINARDAMPEGGRLVISTRERSLSAADLAASPDVSPGTFVEIAVADTGTGMSPEVLEHALEPFFTTKPLGRGTGLGLSQVYGFVRQSGGALRVESSPGQGTTVRLWLPFVAQREEEGGDVPHEAPEPAQQGGDATVLLVDDEAGVREPAAARLRDLGYTVVEAPDGPSAIRLMEGGLRPDLLVTDVGLPGGMDGTRVAEAARRLQPGLRVLFMTGYAAAPLPPDAGVIAKPFTLDALTTRVRRATGFPAGSR